MSTPIATAAEFAATGKGTLARVTTASGLRATAVKLANGSLLEVKRGGVVKKQPYASLDAWRGSFDSAGHILSLTLDTSAAAAPARITPLLPATEDVKTMRKLDSSILRYERPSTVYYWSTYEKLRAEADRIIADPMTHASVKDTLRNFFKDKGPNSRAPLNFQGTHTLGFWHTFRDNKSYVKNFEKDSFEPIMYNIVVPSYPKRIQHILARAFEFPVEEVIRFRGKFGTTFAELGVPLGPDGVPEFWVISCTDGAMTKYKPAA